MLGACDPGHKSDPAKDIIERVTQAFGKSGTDDARRLCEDAIIAAKGVSAADYARAWPFVAWAEHYLANQDLRDGRLQDVLDRVERFLVVLPDDPDAGMLAGLLQLKVEAYLELGVPDQGEQAIREAKGLADKEIGKADPNFRAVLACYFTLAKQRLAVSRNQDAIDQLVAIDQLLDWDAMLAKLGEVPTAQLRATLDLLLGTCHLELARDSADDLTSAERYVIAVRENPWAQPIERFTAHGKLAQIALMRAESERATESIAELLVNLEQHAYGDLPQEDIAWLHSLAGQSALATGADVPLARERLLGSVRTLVQQWCGAERAGGVGFLRYRRAQTLLSTLVAMGSAEQALEVLLETERMGVLWRELGSPTFSALEVRTGLADAEHGCIAFLPGDPGFVLAFDRDRIVLHEFDAAELEKTVRDFMQPLTTLPLGWTATRLANRERDLDQRGSALASALFPAEVTALLADWSHVRLIGVDLIGNLACEALPVIDGKRLGISHAVSRLPSLHVGMALKRRAEPSGSATPAGLRLFCSPVGGNAPANPGADVIPRPSRIFDAMMAAFPARQVELLTGADASIRSMMQPDAPACLWHILAHGLVDLRSEFRARIALAPDADHADGLLTLDRARQLPAPGTVVLMACSAGSGYDRPGDSGAATLGGALLSAGANTVVMSDHDLRLGAATELSIAMYRALCDGASVAEALRRARSALAEDPSYRDLSFGSLIYVYGLGDALR